MHCMSLVMFTAIIQRDWYGFVNVHSNFYYHSAYVEFNVLCFKILNRFLVSLYTKVEQHIEQYLSFTSSLNILIFYA